jgi:multicomponent Na+:H+ antiporter subunit B
MKRPVILATTTRMLLPLMLLFSLFLLLRGHNEPGGGFVGGLVAASSFLLYALANGVSRARRALGVEPRTLVVVGLSLALGAALLGPLTGQPLLTALWLGVPLPVVGKVGTPILFDLGVYLVVLGVTLLIELDLSEAS